MAFITALPNAISYTPTRRWSVRHWYSLFVRRNTNPSALARIPKRLARLVLKKIDKESEFKGWMQNSMPNVMLRELRMYDSLRKTKLRLTTKNAFCETTERLKTRPGHLSNRSKT